MSDAPHKVSSDQFAAFVDKFINSVAPDFKCSVCSNDTFIVEYDDANQSLPVVFRINPHNNTRSYKAVWMCVCDRCGNTYTFNKSFLDRFIADKRPEETLVIDKFETEA